MWEAGQPDDGRGDRELLARFAGGDRDALGELAGRHERRLLGLAKGLLGSRELAEEAVQDSWIRVVRVAGSFGERAEVRTWLYRIVINRCRDIARRERSQRARLNGKLSGGAQPESAPEPTEPEVRAAVRRAVEALPAVEREAVLLCCHADVTHAQAAEILQVPLGTLKSRVRTALSRLERSLRREVTA